MVNACICVVKFSFYHSCAGSERVSASNFLCVPAQLRVPVQEYTHEGHNVHKFSAILPEVV
jgi:hypothetical protein